MKKYVSGQYIDMTPEEISELQQSMPPTHVPEPTTEERIAELEQELAAAKILLGLED